MIRAYKTLQKERDALQTGLSALSAASASEDSVNNENLDNSAQLPESNLEINDDTNTVSREVQYSHESGSETCMNKKESNSEVSRSTECADSKTSRRKVENHDLSSNKKPPTLPTIDGHKQLQSLTLALTDVTKEKEHMQKNFMLERKQMIEEKEKVS